MFNLLVASYAMCGTCCEVSTDVNICHGTSSDKGRRIALTTSDDEIAPVVKAIVMKVIDDPSLIGKALAYANEEGYVIVAVGAPYNAYKGKRPTNEVLDLANSLLRRLLSKINYHTSEGDGNGKIFNKLFRDKMLAAMLDVKACESFSISESDLVSSVKENEDGDLVVIEPNLNIDLDEDESTDIEYDDIFNEDEDE